jgi:uncharacterized protein (TIGR01777 family)
VNLNVLVTGATGLIGTGFCQRAAELGWQVIPLKRTKDNNQPGALWAQDTGQIDLSRIAPLDAVVHLAGETIAQQWTVAAKRRIRDSRINGTRALGEALLALPAPPRTIICASATGYYGEHGSEWVDERSAPGHGFLAEVCQEWEATARREFPAESRLVFLRFGIVLTRSGGALARMLPVFRLGLAGRLGGGRQYWSWITRRDLVRIVETALTDSSWTGPINVVSPNPVTNAEFTRILGRVLRRPTLLPLPRVIVELMLGEMGREALLTSTRVRPTRLMEAGFRFEDPELEGALRAC